MAGRLVDIVLGAAEDNIEWTVCKRFDTAEASTQTSKESSELRSIVYKMVHGSTTFQLLEEHGDAFVEHYANIMSIASKMRLDAYQHLKSKVNMEKEEKERKEKEEKERKEKERKEKERNEEKEGKEKEEKERKEKERKERLKRKKERMESLAKLVKKRKSTPLNTRLGTMVDASIELEGSDATPINDSNLIDF